MGAGYDLCPKTVEAEKYEANRAVFMGEGDPASRSSSFQLAYLGP